MPASSPRHAITRQWQLLKLLPRHGRGLTAAELAAALKGEGYDVTKRTVERDLVALGDLFGITHNGEQPYRWHWLRDASTQVAALSMTEALTAHLLGRYLKPLLPPQLTQPMDALLAQADSKLGELAGRQPLANWARRVAVVPAGLATLPPTVKTKVLETVQKALLQDEALEVDYQRTDEQPRTYTLYPRGLVVNGPVTYLVAASQAGPDPYLYALHRIQAARPSRLAGRPDKQFSLDDYIRRGGLQFGAEKTARFEALVSDLLRKTLLESPLCEDQTITPTRDKSRYRLIATLPISWRLRWWVLSKTGDIEVLRPAELRQEVGRALDGGARMYRSASNRTIQSVRRDP